MMENDEPQWQGVNRIGWFYQSPYPGDESDAGLDLSIPDSGISLERHEGDNRAPSSPSLMSVRSVQMAAYALVVAALAGAAVGLNWRNADEAKRPWREGFLRLSEENRALKQRIKEDGARVRQFAQEIDAVVEERDQLRREVDALRPSTQRPRQSTSHVDDRTPPQKEPAGSERLKYQPSKERRPLGNSPEQ